MARREFPRSIKLAAWACCKGHCECCHVLIRPGNGPHYDHRVPDAVGGEPTLHNCQVLCRACHSLKTAVKDIPEIARTLRLLKKVAKAERPATRPMAGSKASGWRQRMSGKWERRT